MRRDSSTTSGNDEHDMAKLIDGRAIAEKVYGDLRREIAELKSRA